MRMGQSSVKLTAAADMSCCYADAPLPQSQYKASELAPAATSVLQKHRVRCRALMREYQPMQLEIIRLRLFNPSSAHS